jgi:hypothetical protein
MSDQEKFLERWSRRKQKAAEPAKDSVEKPADQEETDVKPHVEGQTAAASAKREKVIEPGFDIKSLPPIELIVASTDIRPFLAPGVPEELTCAALRRAWTTDPAIRDFIGISENSWDFTKSDSMPGFGPLQMTDELRKIVTQMFAHIAPPEADKTKQDEENNILPKAGTAERVAELNPPEKKNIQPSRNFVAQADAQREHIAAQHETGTKKTNDPSPRRGHGSALPK